MARLTEIFYYKEKLIDAITSDQLLMRALVNPGMDALTLPDPDVSDVIYKNVFPYKYNDDTIIEQAKNYIFMDFAATGISGNNFKDISITLYVLVHKTMDLLLNDSQTVVRTDYIAYRLDEIINNKRYGIGKVQFNTFRPLGNTPTGFLGVALIYTTIDFN